MFTRQHNEGIARQRYYAYGSKRGGGDDYPFAPNYTGQRLDGTGLLYDNARYYDPELGMFIAPDSIIPDPSDFFSYNRYLYARGNPIGNHDPTGHAACGLVAFCYDPGFGLAGGLRQLTRDATGIGIGVGLAGPFVGNFVASNQPLMGVIDHWINSGNAQNLPQNFPSDGGNTAGPGGFDPNQFDPWKWTRYNYDKGYEQYYKVTRDSDYAVHHILPQRFENTLSQAGINIHDPRLLREVRVQDPVSGIRWHQVYTNEWDVWARALGRAPTAKEIVDRARAIETAFSLADTLNYRQGPGLPGLVNWEHVMQVLP